MRKSFALLACAALLAAAVTVQAQQNGQGAQGAQGGMTGQGGMSQGQGMMRGQSKDKMLEGSEHYMSRQGYMRLDTDKDGKVSRDEFITGCQERFDVIDSNHDGFISQEELKTVHSRVKKGLGGQESQKLPTRGGQMDQQQKQ